MVTRRSVEADGAEAQAWSALARGDPSAARNVAEAVPPEDRSVRLELALADAACRLAPLSLRELDQLSLEVAAAQDRGEADDVLEPWLAVIRAEHFMLWRTDPASVLVAAQALEALADDPVLPERLLVARGRLRRVRAVWQILMGQPDGLAGARALLAQATDDLNRAGWEVERILSVVLFTMVASSTSMDDLDWSALVLRESLDRLRGLQPAYVPVALACLAYVCVLQGDIATGRAALAEIRTPEHCALRSFVESLRAEAVAVLEFLACAGRGEVAAADAAVEAALETVRGVYPQALASMQREFAHLALDVGRWGRARELAARAEHSPDLYPSAGFDQRLVIARIDVLQGAVDDGVRAGVEAGAAQGDIGFSRRAAFGRLRLARDCAQVGALDRAAALRDEAVADLPADTRRWTFWEALLATAPASDAAASIAAAAVAPASPGSRPAGASWIRTFGADLVVERAGASTVLPDGGARLLAVLVAERVPLTLDRLADRLWPEIDIQSGRTRVNSAVYRLRRALALDRDELVLRGRDRVEIDLGDHWRIDCWEFATQAKGDAGARLQAFELYRGDFCFRQLAYDEPVLGYRASLRGLWIRLAGSLVRDGELAPEVVAERAELLGIDPAELTGLAEITGITGITDHVARDRARRREG